MPIDDTPASSEPSDEDRRVLRQMDVEGRWREGPEVARERLVVRVRAAHDRCALNQTLVEDDDDVRWSRISERAELERGCEPAGRVKWSQRIVGIATERSVSDDGEQAGPVLPARSEFASPLAGREVTPEQ